MAGPSEHTVGRLIEALNRRRQEMQIQVEEGLLRSEIWLEVGRPDAAARVLEEQRRLVDRFRGEVESVLAAAAVEYEAERILQQVAVEADTPERVEEPRRRLVPTAVSAVLSAVAAAAFVVMVVAPPEPAALEAVARAPVVREPVRAVPQSGSSDRAVEPTPLAAALEELAGEDDRRVAAGTSARDDQSPVRIDLRSWLEDQRDLLSRLGVDAPASTVVLRELEDLVTQLLPEDGAPPPVVEDGVSRDGSEADVPDRDGPDTDAAETGDAATTESAADQPPAEEPPADQAPAEEPADDDAEPAGHPTEEPSPHRDASLFGGHEHGSDADSGDADTAEESDTDGSGDDSTGDDSTGDDSTGSVHGALYN